MILSLGLGWMAALGFSARQESILATDYFPLVVGNKWEYESSVGSIKVNYTDEVLTAVQIDGMEAFPIKTTMEGEGRGQVYYRANGDSVLMLGLFTDRLLPKPREVIKVGKGTVKWVYVGEAAVKGDQNLLNMHAESKAIGKRKVLGKEAEIIQVQFQSEIVQGAGTKATIKQVALYARGIGMIEMTEETKSGDRTIKRVVRLTQFVPAKKEGTCESRS